MNRPSLLPHRAISSKAILVDGVMMQRKEMREYASRQGLCERCGTQKTHRRRGHFLKKRRWEPLTLQDEEGNYIVYKGYCLQPTCYTLTRAQEKLGERRMSRRRTIRTGSSDSHFRGQGKSTKLKAPPSTHSSDTLPTLPMSHSSDTLRSLPITYSTDNLDMELSLSNSLFENAFNIETEGVDEEIVFDYNLPELTNSMPTMSTPTPFDSLTTVLEHACSAGLSVSSSQGDKSIELEAVCRFPRGEEQADMSPTRRSAHKKSAMVAQLALARLVDRPVDEQTASLWLEVVEKHKEEESVVLEALETLSVIRTASPTEGALADNMVDVLLRVAEGHSTNMEIAVTIQDQLLSSTGIGSRLQLSRETKRRLLQYFAQSLRSESEQKRKFDVIKSLHHLATHGHEVEMQKAFDANAKVLVEMLGDCDENTGDDCLAPLLGVLRMVTEGQGDIPAGDRVIHSQLMEHTQPSLRLQWGLELIKQCRIGLAMPSDHCAPLHEVACDRAAEFLSMQGDNTLASGTAEWEESVSFLVTMLECRKHQVVLKASEALAVHLVENVEARKYVATEIQQAASIVLNCLERTHQTSELVNVSKNIFKIISSFSEPFANGFLREIANCGGLAAIVNTVECSPKDSQLVELSCHALQVLFAKAIRDSLIVLRESLVDTLAQAVSNHEKDLDTLVAVTDAIRFLCAREGVAFRKVFAGVAIYPLIRAMNYNSEHPEFLASGFAIIRMLTRFDELSALRDASAVELISKAIIEHGSSPLLVKEGLVTISHLAVNPSTRTSIPDLRNLRQIVITTMQSNCLDPEVLTEAFGSLNNLLIDPTTRKVARLTDTSVLETVVRALQKFPQSIPLQKNASLLLKTCAYEPLNFQMLYDASRNLLPILLEMAETSPEKEVRSRAHFLIRNL